MTLARRVAALEQRSPPAEPRAEPPIGRVLRPDTVELAERICLAREAGGPDAEARVAAIVAEPESQRTIAWMNEQLRDDLPPGVTAEEWCYGVRPCG